jgi:signal transduction histidine kinase/ligand-binding sensor domain-containing protein
MTCVAGWIRACCRRAAGLLLFAAALPSPGQPLAFRRFGLNDGLPQSQVSTLLEDRHGFVWLGTTFGGVGRLSGGSFRVFGAAQGVKVRSVVGLLEAPDGSIWAAGIDSGLSRIRGTQVSNFGVAEGLANPAVFSITYDGQGRIHAGTRKGLYRENGKGGFEKVQLPEPWNSSAIWSVERDAQGRIWMGTRGGVIARWDGRRIEDQSLPKPEQAREFVELRMSPSGVLHALTLDALFRLEPSGWVQIPLEGTPGKPKARSVHFGPKGEILVALHTMGLWIRDGEGRVKLLTHQDGLPTESILTAFIDRRGVLWVGSDGGGLAAQALPGLRSIASGGGVELGAIMSVVELAPTRFLLVSSNGLYAWEQDKGITRRWGEKDGLASSEGWVGLADGQGGAWIGTSRGLNHLTPDGRLRPGPKEMDLVTPSVLMKWRDRLWAACDLGLFELALDGRFIARHRPPKEVGQDLVSGIVPKPDGLLVGTRQGLWLFHDGTFERRFPDAPFAELTVNTLMEDASGALWLGTGDGLYQQKGRAWNRYGVGLGLPDDNIYFIHEVQPGRMAIGHGKGVTLMENGTAFHLSRNLGLISDETNQGGALTDSRGRLWIGMIGGVCVLDRASDFSLRDAIQPLVTEVRWDGGSATYPKAQEIPPRPRSLELEFEVASPLVSGTPKFQAKLEGVDGDWRTVSGNVLQYLNLGRGAYIFRLRVTNDGIRWSEAAPVSLEVQPAWHERWPVRILFALAALGAVGGAVAWRLRRLAREAHLLEAKVAERTEELAGRNTALERAHLQLKRSLEDRMQLVDAVAHDLRSPLTSIMLLVDRLRDEAAGRLGVQGVLQSLDQEAARLESIVRSLLNQSRATSIFETINQTPCHPSTFFEGVTDVLALKAAHKGLKCEMDLDPASRQVKVLADTTAMQQVLFNLVENALKFTPAPGTVGIRTRVAGGAWSLDVWDTGRGVDPEAALTIFEPYLQAKGADAASGWGLGLSICKAIVGAHRGSLELVPEPGRKGACFRVTLPLATPPVPVPAREESLPGV